MAIGTATQRASAAVIKPMLAAKPCRNLSSAEPAAPRIVGLPSAIRLDTRAKSTGFPNNEKKMMRFAVC